MEQEIFEFICNTLPIKDKDCITINTSLIDIGVDSIDYIKLIVELESAYNFIFDDEKLINTKFTTIKSLIEYIKSKQHSLE